MPPCWQEASLAGSAQCATVLFCFALRIPAWNQALVFSARSGENKAW